MLINPTHTCPTHPIPPRQYVPSVISHRRTWKSIPPGGGFPPLVKIRSFHVITESNHWRAPKQPAVPRSPGRLFGLEMQIFGHFGLKAVNNHTDLKI